MSEQHRFLPFAVFLLPGTGKRDNQNRLNELAERRQALRCQ
jgi:hypothetical protein